jgi:hypothetical protein
MRHAAVVGRSQCGTDRTRKRARLLDLIALDSAHRARDHRRQAVGQSLQRTLDDCHSRCGMGVGALSSAHGNSSHDRYMRDISAVGVLRDVLGAFLLTPLANDLASDGTDSWNARVLRGRVSVLLLRGLRIGNGRP